jgi:hypothetical protein
LSSRIAALSSPYASAGVPGTQIFRPGTLRNQFSTAWECCAAKPTPPPFAILIVTGTVVCPPVM